ncbi:uncharacterized protein N7503_000904 [Penicillium pulvis]|uniref:uncharacterized protein n=1 Tax=Penicillium pulvis TaxID=1562058 RepID=UPI002549B9B9|nr:uncharacterized protein N7503_000904 [Penicillium pulvis]KAJ5814154.1 hypothetical protein N7503_000904 [Penicillium pulvis]
MISHVRLYKHVSTDVKDSKPRRITRKFVQIDRNRGEFIKEIDNLYRYTWSGTPTRFSNYIKWHLEIYIRYLRYYNYERAKYEDLKIIKEYVYAKTGRSQGSCTGPVLELPLAWPTRSE